MKKKYCVHCRTIVEEGSVCVNCGKSELKEIIFEVQYQKNEKSE